MLEEQGHAGLRASSSPSLAMSMGVRSSIMNFRQFLENNRSSVKPKSFHENVQPLCEGFDWRPLQVE